MKNDQERDETSDGSVMSAVSEITSGVMDEDYSNAKESKDEKMRINIYDVEKHIHYLEDTIMEVEKECQILKEKYEQLETWYDKEVTNIKGCNEDL